MKVSELLSRDICAKDAAKLIGCTPRAVSKARRNLNGARDSIGWDKDVPIESNDLQFAIERRQRMMEKEKLESDIRLAHKEYVKCLVDEMDEHIDMVEYNRTREVYERAILKSKEAKTNYTRLLARAGIKVPQSVKMMETRVLKLRGGNNVETKAV